MASWPRYRDAPHSSTVILIGMVLLPRFAATVSHQTTCESAVPRAREPTFIECGDPQWGLDLSADVRGRDGTSNPMWPVLVGLRGGSPVFKARDWSSFANVPDSPNAPGCVGHRSLRSLNATDNRGIEGRIDQTERRHLFNKKGVVTTALLPLEAMDELSLSRKVCGLVRAFDFVVLGTCDAELSDNAR